MLVFEDVSFAYGEGPLALDGVSFELEPGRVMAVAGANGSGKSTLARCCDALLAPTGGRVTVDGMDTADASQVQAVRERVGMVFQDPDDQIVGALVEEDVAFGPENLAVPGPEIRGRVVSALAAVGLTGMERREPHMLSEGQKQRLAIASALAMDPAYLVLDEPTALLDPRGRADVLGLVDAMARESGHGVLHVSHDLAGVARADRVLVLVDGRVAYLGEPAGLLTDSVLLESAGLSLPPAGELAARLRELGVPIPPLALDAESLVAAIWP